MMKMMMVMSLLWMGIWCNTFLVDRLPGEQGQLNRLKEVFRNLRVQLIKFNTRFENKKSIYFYVCEAQKILKGIQRRTQKHQNVVLGNDNGLRGQDNILVGSNNHLQGDQNWVFRLAGFKGTITEDLIFQRWRIQLDKKQQILTNPSSVITYLKPNNINLSRGSSRYASRSRFSKSPSY